MYALILDACVELPIKFSAIATPIAAPDPPEAARLMPNISASIVDVLTALSVTSPACKISVFLI